jgi:NADPH:quinone reductase-like Zn-dependent oxidoreductase
MKAIVSRKYGPPDVLKLEDVQKPTAADDEILVRVRAASVNPLDRVYRGRPYLIRAMTGWTKPKDVRVGRDVAGTVEAVGKNVTRFRPGDAVFGVARGAFAEHASAREDMLASKPANVSFEEAAATPIAAITALQALRDKARLEPGREILINGAAGGVGTFAVQIAKSFGARVTAVCSSGNVEMVRSLGADQVVDYSKEDFTRASRQYDVVLDCVGNHSLFACCRVIKRKGLYLAVGAALLRHVLYVLMASPFVSQKIVIFMARMRQDDLGALAELLESKKLVPVIGRRYSLPDTAEALRQLETRHTRGKTVITIDSFA